METLSGSAYSLFHFSRTVDLCNKPCYFLSASRPAYHRRFLCMAEEVGFEPTGQIKADTTDFKSVRLCPLAHSSKYCRGFRTLRSPSFGAFERLLRFSFMDMPITHYLIWRNVHQQLHSLLRDFHLLYRGCYDSWQRGWDLNPYTEKARLLVI